MPERTLDRLPAKAPSLVTKSQTQAALRGRPWFAAPMLYVPSVIDAGDAAYALAISSGTAQLVRLR